MSKPTSSNSSLASALAPTPASSIADVIAVMQAIDAVVPAGDGLKWFNSLYLSVTLAIQHAATAPKFADAPWIAKLDVAFANLYFAAASASIVGRAGVPPAWRPLFDSRSQPGIAKIQHALAGTNAHINRDLPVVLTQLARADGGFPLRSSPRHRDYESVNLLLERVEGEVKLELLTGVLRAADGSLGGLEDVLAMWSVRTARDAAWNNGEIYSQLQRATPLAAQFLESLDKTTGLAGRGLLVRI
jgi:hypothetical protein